MTPVIQFTPVDAFHAHSGSVVTATVVVPPAAAMSEAGFWAETWHLVIEGLVELSLLDVQLAPTPADSAATDSAAITRHRKCAISIRDVCVGAWG